MKQISRLARALPRAAFVTGIACSMAESQTVRTFGDSLVLVSPTSIRSSAFILPTEDGRVTIVDAAAGRATVIAGLAGERNYSLDSLFGNLQNGIWRSAGLDSGALWAWNLQVPTQISFASLSGGSRIEPIQVRANAPENSVLVPRLVRNRRVGLFEVATGAQAALVAGIRSFLCSTTDGEGFEPLFRIAEGMRLLRIEGASGRAVIAVQPWVPAVFTVLSADGRYVATVQERDVAGGVSKRIRIDLYSSGECRHQWTEEFDIEGMALHDFVVRDFVSAVAAGDAGELFEDSESSRRAIRQALVVPRGQPLVYAVSVSPNGEVWVSYMAAPDSSRVAVVTGNGRFRPVYNVDPGHRVVAVGWGKAWIVVPHADRDNAWGLFTTQVSPSW